MANLQIPIPDTFQDELKDMIRNAATQAIGEAVKRETTGREWMNQKEACEWLGISYGTHICLEKARSPRGCGTGKNIAEQS